MQVTVAEYLVKRLEYLGVKDVFGLPGDYNFNILDAVIKSKNVNWVNCTNELNAGYAADGYARIKGYGAIVTTYGVGELSAINGVAGAYAENLPVFHIAGVPSTPFIKNNVLVHHNFSIPDYYVFERIYKNVSAGTAYLTKKNAKNEIDRLIDIMVNTKMPVYAAMPVDVCCHCIDDAGFNVINYKKSDKKALFAAHKKILKCLKKSKRPLLFIDYLIKRYDLRKDVVSFIDKTGIQFSTILTGKGAVCEGHSGFLGVNEGNFSSDAYLNALKSSDLLITASFLNSDLSTMGFTAFDRKIDIQINKTNTVILGEVFENVLIADIIKLLSEKAEPLDIIKEMSEKTETTPPPKNGKMTVGAIFPQIEKIFGRGDVFVMETGLMSLLGAELKLKKDMEYLSQTLWGSIGWGTPASFGAQMADKERTTILFTGEGAHQLTIQEMANFFEYNLKPVIFVLNNEGYSVERVLSKDPYDKFNDITKWNYRKVIEGLSGGKDFYSAKVKTIEDFSRVIPEIKANKGKKLCYIEIFTEKTDFTKTCPRLVSNMKHFNETL